MEDALDYLACHAEVVSLDPHTLEEVLTSIIAVGERAGVAAPAKALTDRLRARLAAVSRQVTGLYRPKVAVIERVDPPFTAGRWVPDLVTAAGGIPVAAHPGARSMQTEWTAIADSGPDLVLVAPCGFASKPPARRPRPSPSDSLDFRCGRSTRTPSWSVPARVLSTGSRLSPARCTPAPCRQHRRAESLEWSRSSTGGGAGSCP